MTTFVLRKEFRELGITWLLALLYVVLMPLARWHIDPDGYILGGLVGILVLAVRVFGGEFQNRTFRQWLSQPVSRTRLWLDKVLPALLLVAVLWGIMASAYRYVWQRESVAEICWMTGGLTLVFFGGGLFFTLLFRDMVTAVWGAVLAPLIGSFFLFLIGWLFGVGNWFPFTPTLWTYGLFTLAGSFVLLRRYQDVDRLNADFVKPSWLDWVSLGFLSRQKTSYAPWTALWGKELRLQQGNFPMAGILAALFCGFWALSQNGAGASRAAYVAMLLCAVYFFFTLLPLLIGCVVLAEERRLGTILWQPTLPVAPRQQWLVKMGLAYLLAILLGYGCPWLLLKLALPSLPEKDMAENLLSPNASLLLVLGTATIGIYCSTLARHLLEAVGSGVLVVISGGMVISQGPFISGFWRLAERNMIWLATGGLLFIGLHLLAASNARTPRISARRGWTNVVVFCGLLLSGTGLGKAVHRRTWEVFVPDPKISDRVVLTGTVTPKVAGIRVPYILKPDGELLSGTITREGDVQLAPVQVTPNATQPDRWRDVGVGVNTTYAVRADGTLWQIGRGLTAIVQSGPTPLGQMQSVTPEVSRFQIGTETNWQAVASRYAFYLALKTDGTLWAWGSNNVGQLGLGHTRLQAEPGQVGTDTDWSQLMPGGYSGSMALKQDGSLWSWGNELSSVPEKNPVLTGTWRQIEFDGRRFLGIKRDGSLWSWQLVTKSSRSKTPERPLPVQIGNETDWARLNLYPGLEVALLKQDGALWVCPNFNRLFYTNQGAPALEPVPYARHCLAAGYNLSLHADGTLVGRPWREMEFVPPQEVKKNVIFFLRPSRLPRFVVNVTELSKP